MSRFSVTVAAVTLAFSVSVNAASVLYGISGDGAVTPETLFTINSSDASSSFFMTLGNGADGESIGYNPITGFMNHASGISDGDRYWEEINLSGPSLHSSQQQSGAVELDDEMLDLAFSTATGVMMGTDRNDNLYSFTPDGTGTLIGTTGLTLKGLAFNGGVLFGAEAGGDTLFSISVLDGTAIAGVMMTLDGSPIDGITGLTTNPDDGALWGIVKQGVDDRFLATIDTGTGVVTTIGLLDEKFAGIEFISPSPIPLPAAGWLFISALGGLAVGRRTGNRSEIFDDADVGRR